MRRLLLNEKEKGKLIVIASHSKEDIDIPCDEVFRFDQGKIVQHETTAAVGVKRHSADVSESATTVKT